MEEIAARLRSGPHAGTKPNPPSDGNSMLARVLALSKTPDGLSAEQHDRAIKGWGLLKQNYIHQEPKKQADPFEILINQIQMQDAVKSYGMKIYLDMDNVSSDGYEGDETDAYEDDDTESDDEEESDCSADLLDGNNGQRSDNLWKKVAAAQKFVDKIEHRKSVGNIDGKALWKKLSMANKFIGIKHLANDPDDDTSCSSEDTQDLIRSMLPASERARNRSCAGPIVRGGPIVGGGRKDSARAAARMGSDREMLLRSIRRHDGGRPHDDDDDDDDDDDSLTMISRGRRARKKFTATAVAIIFLCPGTAAFFSTPFMTHGRAVTSRVRPYAAHSPDSRGRTPAFARRPLLPARVNSNPTTVQLAPLVIIRRMREVLRRPSAALGRSTPAGAVPLFAAAALIESPLVPVWVFRWLKKAVIGYAVYYFVKYNVTGGKDTNKASFWVLFNTVAGAMTEEDDKLLCAYECPKCSYMIFPALGREQRQYGKDFMCPECGTLKEFFVEKRQTLDLPPIGESLNEAEAFSNLLVDPVDVFEEGEEEEADIGIIGEDGDDVLEVIEDIEDVEYVYDEEEGEEDGEYEYEYEYFEYEEEQGGGKEEDSPVPEDTPEDNAEPNVEGASDILLNE